MAIVNANAQINGVGGPTNYIRNPRLEGAVAGVIGSGGAYPTNWGLIGANSHTKTIIGTGIDGTTGLPYVDIQFTGTSASGEQFMVLSLDVLNAPCTQGDQFGGSIYLAVVGGSLANITGVFLQTRFLGSGGTPAVNFASSLTGTLQRFTNVFSTAGATTGGQLAWYFAFPLGGATVSVVFRIAGPQFEHAPYVSPLIIQPPAGSPGITNAPLIAAPWQNSATVGGQGGVAATANKIDTSPRALIAGAGGRTNWIRNPRAEGAVVGVIGSGGALPTYWSQPANNNSQQIIGTGTDPTTGLPYIDIRFYGTATTSAYNLVYQETTAAIGLGLAIGDILTASVYVSLVGGSLAGTTGTQLQIRPTGVAGASSPANYQLTSTPTQISVTTAPLTAVTTAATIDVVVYFPVNTAIDITIRISAPQLERGSTVTPLMLPPAGSPGFANAPMIAGVSQVYPLGTQGAAAQFPGQGGSTNYVFNPRGEGGTPGTMGSGGVMPSGWTYNAVAGVAFDYLGQFVVNGIPVNRFRYYGTSTSTGGMGITFNRTAVFLRAQLGGTIWYSCYAQLSGGSLTNVPAISWWGSAADANGAGSAQGVASGGVFPQISSGLQVRLSTSAMPTSGAPPFAINGMGFVFANNANQPFDFTLDLGCPQIELGALTSLILPPIGSPGQTTRSIEALPNVFTTPVLIPAGGGITNAVWNPNAEGAVVGTIGSGGAFPTAWTFPNALGMSIQIIGSGTSDPMTGLPYLDFRVFGTPNATTGTQLYFGQTQLTYSLFPTISNDVWSQSAYVALIAGSTTNVAAFGQVIYLYDSNNAAVGNTPAAYYTPTATMQWFPVNGRTIPVTATARKCCSSLWFSFTSGQAVDFTLRVAAPQLENSPVCTPPILPPLGSPGFTTRGLLAMPVIGNWANIAGTGSVQANGNPARAAGAIIGGVGNVSANAMPLRAAGTTIGGVGSVRATAVLLQAASARIAGTSDADQNPPPIIAQAGASIGGVGSVAANAAPARAAIAQINGTGNVSVTGSRQWQAGTVINGGEGNWLNAQLTPGPSNGTCVVSTDVPPPFGDNSLVFKHIVNSGVSNGNVGALYSGVSSPLIPFVVRAWVWIPAAFGGTNVQFSVEGAGLAVPASLPANLALTNQWQLVTFQAGNPTNTNFPIVCRATDNTSSPFYTALWQVVFDTFVAAPNQLMVAAARVAGVGGVQANAQPMRAAIAQVNGAGGVRATAQMLAQAAAQFNGIGGGETNFIRNPRGEGAVVGTPGTRPTYWSTGGDPMAWDIVSTGVEDGIPYIDFHVHGLSTTTASSFLLPEVVGNTAPVSWPGLSHTLSVYCRIIAGNLTNVSSFALTIQSRDASTNYITQANANFFPLTGGVTIGSQRFSVTYSPMPANAAFAVPVLYVLSNAGSGLAIDLTVRVGGFQMEWGPGPPTQLILPPPGTLTAWTRGIDAGATSAIPGIARINGVGGTFNWIRNPRAEGAVVGPPGTLPTYWVTYQPGASTSISIDVVGTGTEDGIPYIDIRFHGDSPSDSSAWYIYPDGMISTASTAINPYNTNVFLSLYCRLIGGDYSNLYQGQIRIALTYFAIDLSGISEAPIGFTPTTATLGSQRYAMNLATSSPTACYVVPVFEMPPAAANMPIDITLRMGGWQLEFGSLTPFMLPPVGAPGVTNRPLIAGGIRVTPVSAQIGGVGGVQANAQPMRTASTQVAGVGGAQAAGAVYAQAASLIPDTGAVLASAQLRVAGSAAIAGLGSFAAVASGAIPAAARISGTSDADQNPPIVLAQAAATIAGTGSVAASGTQLHQTYQVGATIAGTGSFGAAASVQAVAGAPIAGVGGFAANGVRQQPTGNQLLAGVGNVQASVVVRAQAAFEADGQGLLSVTPSSALPGRTTIAGVGNVSATPSSALPAIARIAGLGGLQPGLVLFAQTSATIAGTGGVQANAIRQAPGSAEIDGTATVAANGMRLAPAAATIAGVGGVQALPGIVGATSRATIAGVGSVVAAGSLAIPVSAQINGVGSFAADGTQLHQTYQVGAIIAGVGSIVRLGATVPAQAQATIAGQGAVQAKTVGWIPVAASIAGVGNVRASTVLLGQQPGSALIAGVGGVRAAASFRLSPAIAEIDGGASNRLPINRVPTISAGDTVVVSTDIDPPIAGAQVYRHDWQLPPLNNSAGFLTTAFTPLIQHTFSAWVWVPSSYTGTYVIFQAEGAGITTTTQAIADMTKRDQWQFVTGRTLVAPNGNFNVVCRYSSVPAPQPPIYTSLWSAIPSVVQATGSVIHVLGPGAGATITGQGAVQATSSYVASAVATIRGTGSVAFNSGLRMRPAQAQIGGTGTVRAVGTIVQLRSLEIDGVGRVHATAVVHLGVQASAQINGLGTFKGSHAPGGALVSAGARLAGTGSLAAAARPHRPGDNEIDGEGNVAADASVRAAGRAHVGGLGSLVATVSYLISGVRARIAGVGVLDPDAGVTRSASATINGAGQLRADATVLHRTVPFGCSIQGAGVVQANATVAAGSLVLGVSLAGSGTVRANASVLAVPVVPRAEIAGVGTVKPHERLIAALVARIAGTGRVQADAHKAPFYTGATIHGTGALQADARAQVFEAARIAGRGTVTARASILALASAEISGFGRLRAALRELLVGRARIPGQGAVQADGDNLTHHHATALIAGEGMLAADAWIPRDRVAQYGVHLPPTARGTSLSPQPQGDTPVALPPTRRSVSV